jgi:hypothetical protein
MLVVIGFLRSGGFNSEEYQEKITNVYNAFCPIYNSKERSYKLFGSNSPTIRWKYIEATLKSTSTVGIGLPCFGGSEVYIYFRSYFLKSGVLYFEMTYDNWAIAAGAMHVPTTEAIKIVDEYVSPINFLATPHFYLKRKPPR